MTAKLQNYENYDFRLVPKNVNVLHCEGLDITSLDGIEKLENLEVLWCFRNSLKSLRPLGMLTKLQFLWCTDNEIISLDGLQNLLNLEELHCDNVGLKSLRGVPKNVEFLSVNYNQIRGNLEYILGLKKLKNISIRGNEIISYKGLPSSIDEYNDDDTDMCLNLGWSDIYHDIVERIKEKSGTSKFEKLKNIFLCSEHRKRNSSWIHWLHSVADIFLFYNYF